MYWAQKKGINIYFFWLEYAHMYSIHFIVVKAWLESPPLLDFWAFGCVNITFHNLIFFFFFLFFWYEFCSFFPVTLRAQCWHPFVLLYLSTDKRTYIYIFFTRFGFRSFIFAFSVSFFTWPQDLLI